MTSALRRVAFGLVPAIAWLGTGAMPVHAIAPVPNAYLAQNEFATATGANPFDIITGPNGNIWYTAPGIDSIVEADPATGAVLNTYVVTTVDRGACQPLGITIGPDRNIWSTCFFGDALVRIIPSTGAIHIFNLPPSGTLSSLGCRDCPGFLTPGPNGLLWFTESNVGYVSQINVNTGKLYRYPLPAGAAASPNGIAVGADGNLWFTEPGIDRIGRMSPTGTLLSSFVVPTAGSAPAWIVPGPDGNLYYTEVQGNNIVRLTMSGVSTEIPVPTPSAGLRGINVGPDGNLWFAEADANQIGSMTPGGVFQETAVLTRGVQPVGIAAGPYGDMWFAESTGDQIGKIGTRHSALTLDKSAVGWNLEVGADGLAQRITLHNDIGSDPLAALTPVATGQGFLVNGETCSAGTVAADGTCYADVAYDAQAGPANGGSGRVNFPADPATAYEQSLSAGLTTTVNVPACKSVAVAPDLTSPQIVGATVSLVATAVGCSTTPLYKFWLRSPAGVWSIVRQFGSSNTFVWNTTGYKAGTYLFGVWAKDQSSPNTAVTRYDAYAFGTFTLQFPSCTSTNLSGDVSSPKVIGTTVNFTASALGCPSPLFQWWVRNPAGVWSIAVSFAAGNTYAWNTTGLQAGTWQIGIWAKQVGSTKSYDAFASLTFSLSTAPFTGPPFNQPCYSVNIDAAPASPQDKGTPVTLTTSVLGCDAPQYRFWIRDTSGVWAVVQDYSTTSSYAWSTASRPAGTYLVGVWVRQTGDCCIEEAYSFITYTLTVPPASQPCSSVGITPTSPSPQPPGRPVTFTADPVVCGGTPEYKFFVAPPGGAFGVVQNYSASNSYDWVTPLVEGPYQVGVWVRNAGSTKSYEAFAFITFQVQSTDARCSTLSMYPGLGASPTDIYSQSPQATGALLTWNASALGCTTAEYAFYVQKPGSTFKVLQSYGAATNAVWNTAGLPRGIYKVKVLTRRAGSAAPFDVYAISTYELV